MGERKASDLFVECLEAEGVRYVFGIPGEETLDLNESLEASSIEFVPVRHEQGGAYMADMYGRLTRSAGVCLGTLGPGATNLVTGVADALLDRSPMVALTGQADLERMHKESHQYIDVVDMLRPVTKFNARLNSARVIPEVVRKAFKVAQAQKPGPTHIELPEDVMAAEVDAEPLPVRRAPPAEPSPEELQAALERDPRRRAPDRARRQRRRPHRRGRRPARVRLHDRHRRRGDVHGQGDARLRGPARARHRRAAVARLRARGLRGRRRGDHGRLRPRRARAVELEPARDKRIVCIDTVAPEVDEHFMTEVDLIGDLSYILTRLAEELAGTALETQDSRLNEIVLGRFEAAKDDDAFPMQPPRALWEIRQALGRRDILISDVGLHKLWIARMFPAHEPDTVFIANGLAGMGIALPTAIAAKLVRSPTATWSPSTATAAS